MEISGKYNTEVGIIVEETWNSTEAGNIMETAWKIYGINVEIAWNSEMVWE